MPLYYAANNHKKVLEGISWQLIVCSSQLGHNGSKIFQRFS